MTARYYWLKLKKDFFTRPEIVMLEKRRRGRETLLFYLKLLLQALESGGVLEYAEGQPHTVDTLAATCNTPRSFVRRALRRLRKAGLLEMRDSYYYLPGVTRDTGSETKKAETMRRLRKNNKVGNNVTVVGNNVTQRKSIEKEKEKESELDYCTGSVNPCAKPGTDLTDWEQQTLLNRLGRVKLLHYLEIAEMKVAMGQAPPNLYAAICEWEREGTYPME